VLVIIDESIDDVDGGEVIALTICQAQKLRALHREMLLNEVNKANNTALKVYDAERDKKAKIQEEDSPREVEGLERVQREEVEIEDHEETKQQQKINAREKAWEREGERQAKELEARLQKEEVEAQKRAALQKYMDEVVMERGKSLQVVRDLNFIPTPFTLHFSHDKDCVRGVEILSPADEASEYYSSGSDSDSQDSESARDLSDKPRDLEEHFRVRFNASGLGKAEAPIDIKKPLSIPELLSPHLFKEHLDAGFDRSVNQEKVVPEDSRPRSAPHFKVKTKPLLQLKLEASRRGLGELIFEDKNATSLYSSISLASSPHARENRKVSPRASLGKVSQVSSRAPRSVTGKRLQGEDSEEELQSASLHSLSYSLDHNSAEQNISAAHYVSSVDDIFKENGGKVLVPRDRPRKNRPATALAGLARTSLDQFSSNSLFEEKSDLKGSLQSLSRISLHCGDEVFKEVTLKGLMAAHGNDIDHPEIRHFEHPDPRPGFVPGFKMSSTWSNHVAPQMELAGKREVPQPRPNSAQHSYNQYQTQLLNSEKKTALVLMRSPLMRSPSQASQASSNGFTLGDKARFLFDARDSKKLQQQSSEGASRFAQKLMSVISLDSKVQAKNRVPLHMRGIEEKAEQLREVAKRSTSFTRDLLSPHDCALLDALLESGQRRPQRKRADSPPPRMLEPHFNRVREGELPLSLRFIHNMAPGLTIFCCNLYATPAPF
jgi:hypothetical protein